MQFLKLTNHYESTYLISSENIAKEAYVQEVNIAAQRKDIYFYMKPLIKKVERAPSSLVDAISRLGGVLAIVNIVFFIGMVNRRVFTKEL